ncbi:hypothetical protein E5L68_017135 [Pedobacter helvus]|uniref:Uncharacterized protein n=1 Tax=Pedobacter helvus TaxID=2563444 RepID=A0ABW9JKZ0_9SPHI
MSTYKPDTSIRQAGYCIRVQKPSFRVDLKIVLRKDEEVKNSQVRGYKYLVP